MAALTSSSTSTPTEVLAESNVDEQLPPASLTKIMTSYLAAQEIEAGRISLTDNVPISVKAWKAPGSRMFIREGTDSPTARSFERHHHSIG